MLRITIPDKEYWDGAKEIFVYKKGCTINLEHSLVSLSKWESRFNKPFLTKEEKTMEETVEYIKCMTLTQNVDPDVYNELTLDNYREIERYIESPMTATVFSKEQNRKTGGEQVTSELIYYWMVALNVPFECQKWHLNRLLTLIKVCNIKNSSPERKSTRDIMKRNSALNAARRKRYNTRG